MKKLSLFVVGILLLSGITTLGLSKEADMQMVTINNNFSQLKLNMFTVDDVDYVELRSDDNLAVLHHAGRPLLLRNIQTIELPFGTKINNVDIGITRVETATLSYKILPAPQPVIQGLDSIATYEMDEAVYSSNEYYPNDWVTITSGGGLNGDNQHVTFVTIETYPVRYNPAEDVIQFISDIELTINYEPPTQPLLNTADEFDMVIIAPETFSKDLQELIDHKNSVDVKTYLKTTEDIYNEYDGVDKPEQIKYFIKDALDNQGISYVMLVGGMTSPFFGTPRDDKNQGTKNWYVPVRYTNNKEMGGTHDPGFISDMYYADIYDGEGNFSSWDKDRHGESDGIFANWQFRAQTDYLDLYPDVYVGRLACRNSIELGFMVDKIIEYETQTAGSSWFNKIIGVGGDSHDDTENFCEGEVLCDYVFNQYMDEFSPVKLYSSYKESKPEYVPSDVNIVREVTNGAGFLLFDGHGSPGSWNTHWPGIFNWGDTPGGISTYDFFDFNNAGKYPISVIGGCHNSQFNITLLSTALNKPYTWAHGVPYAECFGWHLARKKDGGAIASMGNTGLGYGAVGDHGDVDGDGVDNPDTVEGVGGYQEVMFFKAIDEGVDILGEAWGTANRYYLNTFPAMEDQTDCKTVEQWPLLGDPSLKIGGYS